MSQHPQFVLADELDRLREGDYQVLNETDPRDLDHAAQATLVDGLIESLSNPSCIEADFSEDFSALLSLIKHYPVLSGTLRNKLVDALASAYAAELDLAARELEAEGTEAYKSHAGLIERYAFAVQWLIHVAEKAAGSREEKASAAAAAPAKKGRGAKSIPTPSSVTASTNLAGYDWPKLVVTLLSVLLRSLRLSTGILFPLTPARDAFVSGCVLRPVLLLQENEAHLKVPAIRVGVQKVVCSAVKGHGQAFAVQTSIIQALAYFEHLAEPMAELLCLLRVEFDYERLGEEVLRDVASRDFGGLDTKSPRAFGRFLVRMAELNPRTVLRQIGLLVKHMDSESYPMRNSMLEILGLLIRELTMTDDALPGGGSSGEGSNSAGAAGGNEGSVDEQRGSAEARKKQVAHFWELITDRFLDVTSYVRCKCIAVSAKLCELPAKFPAQRTLLTDLAIQALNDKSSSARKNAINLLSRLVLTHPYGLMHGGDLDEAEWRKRLEGLDAELAKFEAKLNLPKEDEEDEDEDEEIIIDDADELDSPRKPRPKARRSSAGAVLDVAALQASQAQLSAEDAQTVVRLRLTRRYYVDALYFIEQLTGAMPVLQQLLVSTSKAEVLESMEFFRIAHEYNIPGASAGVRKMVHLIWTKDNALVMEDGSQLKGVRSRLIEVYRSLYFEPLAELSPKDNVNRIARNMIERTFGATLAELTSLEELFSTMCGEGMVHEDVVAKLWAVYSAPRAIPRAQRRGAIIVLSMLAVARREIVSRHVDVLLGVGLGPLGAKDVVLAKYTCVALSRVGGSIKKVKGALSDEQQRFPMSHPMFAKLRAAVLWHSTSGEWFSLAEHAIQTIYLLGEQPDALSADIIRNMTARVFGPKGPNPQLRPAEPSTPQQRHSELADVREEDEEEEEEMEGAEKDVEDGTRRKTRASSAQASDKGEVAEEDKASAFALAQLLFVVGHVALKQIVYLELVEREYKRRKAGADKAKILSAKDANAEGGAGEGGAANGAKGKGGRGKKGKKEAASDAAGDELDQVAGNAEDEIGDVVSEVREKELLYGHRSLLALFGPVVAHICQNPKTYPNDFLRKAAVTTLCKFMCVSSAFCEAHLPLSLSILSASSDPVVRSNLVIALGDIAISFGNLVDDNSDRLYAGLADKDLSVKKHTLMVLTHLILNGMIKVKGQLGEMAKCLEDPEERVSDLAKLFFSELATKENAVYNNLPDIISHLSIGAHAVDEETFARTMRFIFTFIDKEKQAENVVEKLCQRFRIASEERQWRDIAYCLSLLPFRSDRSIKRLIEGLPFYQDKLHDPTVYKRFTEIVAKARGLRGAASAGGSGGPASAASNETDLAEFEQILESFKTQGTEDALFEGAAQAKVAKAAKARQRRKLDTANFRAAPVETATATMAGGGMGGKKQKAAPAPVGRSAAVGKRRTRAAPRDSDDED